MIWLSLAIIAALAILSLYSNKKLYSPGAFLCIEWGIILLFYKYNAYGYNEVDHKTLILLTTGIGCFVLGSYIAGFSKRKFGIRKRSKAPSEAEQEYSYNKKLLYILLIISFVYCFWKIIIIDPMNLLTAQGFGRVRLNWLDGGGLTGARDETFYNMFILPFVYVNIVVAIINVTLYHKDRLQLILTLADVAMITLYTGGRMLLMDIIVMLLVALRINKVKIKLNISRRRKVIIAAVIVIAMVVLNRITYDRQGIGLVQVVMGNFSLSVPLLDYVVKAADASHDLTYGHIFIRGFAELPLTVLAFLGIELWPAQYQTLSKYTNPFFRIGTATTANAYVTSFFYFYLDARWIGVILFSFVFGYFSQKIYKNAIRDGNDKRLLQKNRAFYLVIITAVLRTFFYYSFSKSTYVMLMILILTVFTRKRIKTGRTY